MRLTDNGAGLRFVEVMTAFVLSRSIVRQDKEPHIICFYRAKNGDLKFDMTVAELNLKTEAWVIEQARWALDLEPDDTLSVVDTPL